MTQAECDALRQENDIDPTGEYGLRILDRHLLAIDRVKELCRSNPNKPKVREAILAEYRSFAADVEAISREAAAKFEERKMYERTHRQTADDINKALEAAGQPIRVYSPELGPLLFEEIMHTIRRGNLIVRSLFKDDNALCMEIDVTTAWASQPLHVHGRLHVKGKLRLEEGRIESDAVPEHTRCLVKDCPNHRDQGTFVGNLCYSCYQHLTTGKIGPTESILRKIRDAELFVLKGPDGKIVTQGQFNALVAENASLKEKLNS